ncbi:MAG: hypothetical protein JNL67_10220 [Planctomycetaceae bacterium]|nr:hypothetical protein [Planctomycetaceae bacterium]
MRLSPMTYTKLSRRGNTAVEYAIVLGLIVIACLSSIQMLGQNVRQVMERASGALMGNDVDGAVASPMGTEVSAPEVIQIELAPPRSR